MSPLHQPHRPNKLSLQDLEVRLLLLVLMLTINIDITTYIDVNFYRILFVT